jgi:hypothetical protein
VTAQICANPQKKRGKERKREKKKKGKKRKEKTPHMLP